jgi:pimeloyl-ACP methyl ester carboxylesterase
VTAHILGQEYTLSPALVAGSPTIVFLHEGLGSLGLWRDFPRQLAEATGCGALVYSRRGYGNSEPITLPRPLDYMEQEGERELPLLLGALKIEEPLLFGHSDGASIALVCAGSGLAVRGLVLEAPHVFAEELSIRSIEKARDAYDQGHLRERLSRWHANNVDNAFRGWNGAWLDAKFRDWNIERYLSGVRAPTLLLQGLDDEYGTRAQLDAIVRAVNGKVQLDLLEHCGHAPHKEQPERTLAIASAFIRGLL